MPPQLTIEYHQQEKPYFCGAACAQMVLNQIGVPHTANRCRSAVNDYLCNCTGTPDLCQCCLYEESNDVTRVPHPERGWFSHPEALTLTMNNRRPAAFAARFVFFLFELNDAGNITHKIAWTIHHYGVAPVAMVLADKHWVVVTGYEAPADPVSLDADPAFVRTITGFWIHDPFPESPTGYPPGTFPPPHTSTDICGDGYIAGDNWGTAHDHLPIAEWFDRYMVGVTGGYWDRKFLAICDPESGPKEPVPIPEKKQVDSYKLMAMDEVADRATKALKDHKIPGRKFLPKKLKKAKPGKPLLVKCIDRKDDYYYIVPMRGSDARYYGLVSINAYSGEYKQSTFPKRKGYLKKYRPFAKKEIRQRLNEEISLSGIIKEKLSVKDLQILPTLVWMPCNESLSPFYPFQVVSAGDLLLYVRIDGKIFTHLSTDGKGM